MKVFEGLAGGILLGGGLLHLIPDASESLSEAILHNVQKRNGNEDSWFIHFPWAPVLATSALLIIYFLEHVLMGFVEYFLAKKLLAHEHDEKNKKRDSETDIDMKDIQIENGLPAISSTTDLEEHETKVEKKRGSYISIIKLLNTVVLWLSLCTHSLFEGLGLGAETDSHAMWSIFAAIMAHKGLESFTLGVIVEKGVRNNRANNATIWQQWRHITYFIFFVLSFTVASPLGIGIGIAVTQTGHNHEADSLVIVQSCLLAFASGSFIYIALFEILGEHDHAHGEEDQTHHHGHKHDHHKKKHPLYTLSKFLLFILGFIVMAILAVWG